MQLKTTTMKNTALLIHKKKKKQIIITSKKRDPGISGINHCSKLSQPFWNRRQFLMPYHSSERKGKKRIKIWTEDITSKKTRKNLSRKIPIIKLFKLFFNFMHNDWTAFLKVWRGRQSPRQWWETKEK
jgi:hypothetical protein